MTSNRVGIYCDTKTFLLPLDINKCLIGMPFPSPFSNVDIGYIDTIPYFFYKIANHRKSEGFQNLQDEKINNFDPWKMLSGKNSYL